jgi:hypothetical protein
MNTFAFIERVTGLADPAFWLVGVPLIIYLFGSYILVPLYFDKKFPHFLPLFKYDYPGNVDHIFGRPIIRLVVYFAIFICDDKTKNWHSKRIRNALKKELYIKDLGIPYRAEKILGYIFFIYMIICTIIALFYTIEAIIDPMTWETRSRSSLAYLVQFIVGLIIFPPYFIYLFVKKRISNKKTRDL